MKKIMVVDDAAFMRGTLKMMLERNGFQVIGEAENGAIAVQKYAELKPDIVTMDITMPEMTGIEALTKIKEMDSSAKIIMISALGQESYVKEAIIKGAKGFLVKPFKEEAVVKAISAL